MQKYIEKVKKYKFRLDLDLLNCHIIDMLYTVYIVVQQYID